MAMASQAGLAEAVAAGLRLQRVAQVGMLLLRLVAVVAAQPALSQEVPSMAEMAALALSSSGTLCQIHRRPMRGRINRWDRALAQRWMVLRQCPSARSAIAGPRRVALASR